jgi:hypothetical protein
MSRYGRGQGLWAAVPAPSVRSPEAKRRVGRAAAIWGALALGSIVTITAMIIWHLIRRGRLIRERLQPPRKVDLAVPMPADPGPAPEPAPGAKEG